MNAMECKQTVNGVTYDLSPLSGVDYAIKPAAGAYDYWLHICGDGVTPAKCNGKTGIMSCQVRKSPVGQFEAVTAFSDVVANPPAPTWSSSSASTGGVKLTFTNGDSCNLRQRITIFDFQCDYNGTRVMSVDENPQCQFNYIIPTPVTCTGYAPTDVPTTTPTTTPTLSPSSSSTGSPSGSSASPGSGSSPSSSNTDIVITGAGIGIGIAIGFGAMAVIVLIWCACDRARKERAATVQTDGRREPLMNAAGQYGQV